MTAQPRKYGNLARRYAVPFAAALLATPIAAQNQRIEVPVMTDTGESAGTVTFEQVLHGVAISARLENLTEGAHGFHIHETGACSPDFGAAGGHYDTLGANHGFDSSGGYHVGDLPNIYVASDGTARADFFAPHLSLAPKAENDYPFTLSDADGSAVMVHAQIDDYKADPAGSSGSRAACGVIVPAD